MSSPAAPGFCSSCGAKASKGAKFCAKCGLTLGSSAAPATSRAGLAVLAGFLALGLGLWFAILKPVADPGRRPLAPRAPATTAATAPQDGDELPPDHPPVSLPEQVTRAIAELETTAEATPDDPGVWLRLALVQYRAGQVDPRYVERAELSFSRVLELDAENLDAIRGLGNIHFDRNEHAAAIERYSRYLELSPAEPTVRTDLGTMYLYSGDQARAIEEYQKVVEADPEFFQGWFNLGIAYRQTGDEQKSEDSFREALRLAPDETTKNRIRQVLGEAPVEVAPTPAPEPVANPETFQGRVETYLRAHPILGPKLVRLEWTDATNGRVHLDGFPMEAMPPAVRDGFLAKVRDRLVSSLAAAGESGPASLEIVDAADGALKATITSE